MDKNICHKCGTANEKEYTFCKNCGAELKNENQTENTKTENSSQQYGKQQKEYNNSKFVIDNIDGIPADEVAAFIGRKHYEIMPKLSKMELTNSKFSWCWPCAVLGFIMGPFGVALWFFYRKVYKPAIILSIIGTVLAIITTILTFETNSAEIQSIFEALLSDNPSSIFNSEDTIVTETTLLYSVAILIENIASIFSSIYFGLFAYNIYKNHCITIIRKYRNLQHNPQYYNLGLSAIGGVSGGMLAVGILIQICVNYFTSFLTTAFSIMV